MGNYSHDRLLDMGCEHLSCKLFWQFYFNSDITIERHIWGTNQSVTLMVCLQQPKDSFLLLEL